MCQLHSIVLTGQVCCVHLDAKRLHNSQSRWRKYHITLQLLLVVCSRTMTSMILTEIDLKLWFYTSRAVVGSHRQWHWKIKCESINNASRKTRIGMLVYICIFQPSLRYDCTLQVVASSVLKIILLVRNQFWRLYY